MLAPPRGNIGSSSFKIETTGAFSGASALFLGASFASLPTFSVVVGRASFVFFADLAGGLPPGASFRLRLLIVQDVGASPTTVLRCSSKLELGRNFSLPFAYR